MRVLPRGAAVAGSVIISEIMWGLDGASPNSQYIELHNTTAAAIGIDNNEWVIAVGSGADTTYTTVVDTVGKQSGWRLLAGPGNRRRIGSSAECWLLYTRRYRFYESYRH